jgi:carbamoyltransferase
MATAFRMKEEFREILPSAVHVDGTARPQFVEYQDNPSLYRLLKEVKKQIGFGVVINTSFNLHGRTIVHTPKDAIQDFLDCNIDELYLEDYKITRRSPA